MRIGEICGLQWSDVDLERGTIRIKHSLSRFDGLKGPKTAAGIRTLPLSPPARQVLEGIKASAHYGPALGHVYRGNDGSPIPPDSARRDTFYRIMFRAGLAHGKSQPFFNLHSLRHAALSLLAEKGLPPLHLKQIAGHKSVTTTMDIYGHLFPCDTADRRIIGEVASEMGLLSIPNDQMAQAEGMVLTEEDARELTATQRWRMRQQGASVPLLRADATRERQESLSA